MATPTTTITGYDNGSNDNRDLENRINKERDIFKGSGRFWFQRI